MNPNIFWLRSLKTRVTLFTLAIFVLSMWLLAFYASRMLREDMQRLLGEQQFSTASFIAAAVDAELGARLSALETVARSVTPAMLGNTAALQARLEARLIFQSLFNGGAFATLVDGIATASIPLSAERNGVSYMDRDYIVAALKEGKTSIGRPVMGRQLKAPGFGMAVPIRDTQGKVIGALAGVVNLGLPNFLEKITQGRFGKTGGYILIAPQYRLIVTATDKSRIMEVLPAPGIIPEIDRFIQGYEGSDILVNPLGVEVLASAKVIPVAGWFAAVVLPTEEAFAAIRAMQQRILIATIFLTLLAGALTWWMLGRQLSPMLTTVKTLATLSDTNQPPQPLAVDGQDEIGELIGGFNRLLETLAQREEALYESEARFRNLVELSSDYYWETDIEHRIAQRVENDRSTRGSVFSDGSPIGQRRWEIPCLSPDESAWQAHRAALDAHLPFRDFVFSRLAADGTERHISISGDPVFDASGNFAGYRGVGADITERKRMEEQVRQMALHDTLTDLPNRRLLNDRLSQAMAASKRSGCHGTLMFLDLDNFKLLNDAHGHAVGDLLLLEVANRLKRCVREMDTVARFGGDEFVVMIGELDADKSGSTSQAGIIGEKIRAALAKPYVLNVQHEGRSQTTIEYHCTASIGITLFGKHEASEDDILKRADTAMYQAKEAGNNLIRFYE